MSVEERNNRRQQVEEQLKRERAEDLNFQAAKHIAWAEFRCPVDKGNLVKTIRQTEEATPEHMHAVVRVGGMAIGGVEVDYPAPVNFGSNHGTYSIPPNPFWTEAEDVGRQAGERRAGVRKIEHRRSGLLREIKSTYGLEQ